LRLLIFYSHGSPAMARLDASILPVVTDLERGLRALGIQFAVVGALVPELLLDVPPDRMTNDADVTVTVESLAEFERLKDQLADFGFARTVSPYRLHHRSGGRVDILPFSHAIAPEGHLELQRDRVLNMAGFEHVVPSAQETAIEGGPTLPLIPLPLYALLKLVAFDDRRAPKDLAGVLHCLRHYPVDDERRYGTEHAGVGVPFEQSPAYLLGVDGQVFLGKQLNATVTRVLDRFGDIDADVVDIVLRERGRIAIEENDREDVFEQFRWYRFGVGL
jgi:predicted nucleotidyltransferase